MFWYSCFTAFPFNGTILCWYCWCIVTKLITNAFIHSRKLKIFWFKKSVVTTHQRHPFLAQISTKSFSGWGFVPAPMGSSQRSPDSLAGKGRGERRGGEGRKEEGGEGKGGELKFKSGYALAQSHRNRHRLIRHIWFPINVPWQRWDYLILFPKNGDFSRKSQFFQPTLYFVPLWNWVNSALGQKKLEWWGYRAEKEVWR